MYVALVVVSAFAIGAMSFGLYRQGRDIERIQATEAAQRAELCTVLNDVSATLDKRTLPIKKLLIERSKDARQKGNTELADQLASYTTQIEVPPTIACP